MHRSLYSPAFLSGPTESKSAMQTKSRRSGFTLVELLVVIAIIGTLMGLLLPAVQSAREAGRRNTCMNNLSQLAKAMTAYDAKSGALPSWKHKYPNSAAANRYTSWVIPLLPHIERSDVYRSIESLSSPPATLTLPIIELFSCPTSPSADTTTSTIAYSANIGTTQSLNPLATSNVQAKGDGALVDAIAVPVTSGSYAAARSTLDNISSGDGTSTTLLLSEKCGATLPTQANWGSVISASGNFDWTNGFSYPAFGIPGTSFSDVAAPSSTLKPINGTAGAVGNYGLPSSLHPGGVVAGFCDGHVQFVVDAVTPYTYAQLVTSDSRYDPTKSPSYHLNSVRANNWLLLAPSPAPPYLLQEADYR
jgi:prepilin-type N-terminal cleavage/methylation domain-containing protein/prepilin-type processing-associated H-X9-DG protein